MAKAYVVCDITVTDPAAYEEYRKRSGPALDAHGGRFLVRGGETEPLEGQWSPQRFVLIEFPDADAARRWYDSPEYREARAARAGAAECSFLLAPGAEQP